MELFPNILGIYHEAVDTYPTIMQSVIEYCKTQEMCDKAANTCFLYSRLIKDTKNMSQNCFQRSFYGKILWWKAQKTCDEDFNDSHSALSFAPDWFVTNKMIRELHEALFANYDILFFDEDFGNITLFANKMDILSTDLDKIDLDGVDFDEEDPETIFHVRILAGRNKFEKRKAFKKDVSKKLMHPTKQWNWCLQEDEKKKKRTNFYW